MASPGARRSRALGTSMQRSVDTIGVRRGSEPGLTSRRRRTGRAMPRRDGHES